MKEVNPETFTTDISGMNKRKAFAILKDFVLGDECYQGEILAVCGLKRTGKTTLLKQLLCDIVAYTASCAFLEMQDSDTMKMLERRIEEEQAKGKTVIFINEITKVSDFINNSSVLADCFAKAGARIIISGMDSLSVAFAEDYELYDRVRKVNTTYISFAEYHTLFPSEDINDYIRYGGLFYKNEAEKSTIGYENILSYLHDAVTMNIANSLKNNADIDKRDSAFKNINETELKSITEKAAGLYSGSPDGEIITALTDKKDNAEQFARMIGSGKNADCYITPQMIKELEKWLKEIGFLAFIGKRTFTNVSGVWKKLPPTYEYHIVQPAVRYSFLKKAAESEIERYQHLDKQRQKEMAETLNRNMLDEIVGQTVIFDVMSSLPDERYIVCKPEFMHENRLINGYDMLIYDRQENSYRYFLIRRKSDDYADNIEEITSVAESHFGECKSVCMLYAEKSPNGFAGRECYNISDFLIAVDKYGDMDKVMISLKKRGSN